MGITEKTCEKIRAAYEAGYTVTEIAKTFGLREGTVRVIIGKK